MKLFSFQATVTNVTLKLTSDPWHLPQWLPDWENKQSYIASGCNTERPKLLCGLLAIPPLTIPTEVDVFLQRAFFWEPMDCQTQIYPAFIHDLYMVTTNRKPYNCIFNCWRAITSCFVRMFHLCVQCIIAVCKPKQQGVLFTIRILALFITVIGSLNKICLKLQTLILSLSLDHVTLPVFLNFLTCTCFLKYHLCYQDSLYLIISLPCCWNSKQSPERCL